MPFFNQKILKDIILPVICACLVILPNKAECESTHDVGIINVNRLNLRAEPRRDAPVVKVLDKGAQVRILERQKGWFQVFHEGDIGYVMDQNEYITLYTIHTVTDTRGSDLEKAKSKVKDFLKRIEQRQSEIETFNKHEKEIVAQMQDTDLALSDARRKSSVISADLAKVKDEIVKTQQQADEIEKAINKGKAYAFKRLVALYKLNTLGEMNLFASANSVYDLQRNKWAVENILSHDEEVIGSLVEEKKQFSSLIAQLNEKKASQSLLENRLKDAIKKLAQENTKREKILSELKTQKNNSMVTLKYLKDSAERLDQTIEELSKEPSNYENKSANSFSACQGLLKKPVKGNVINKYGQYVESQSGATNFRNGIEFEAERGAPISAVFSGQVVFSDWLKGYGNVIIITHGDNYYTVYAHAEELFRTKGDDVQTGDVIATVGDTGSMSGPTLYFEIRHHGNSVDPMKWLSRG